MPLMRVSSINRLASTLTSSAPGTIVGAELVRVRSQTIYYVLTRIKGICKVFLDRQRMAESQVA